MTDSFDPSELHRRSLPERLLSQALLVWMLRAAVVALAVVAGAAVAAPAARTVTMAIIGLGGLGAVQAMLRWSRGNRGRRLAQVASANGFAYHEQAPWGVASALLHGAVNPRAIDVFTRSEDRLGGGEGLTLGSLEYRTERAGVRVTERWAFVQWRLPAVTLPHLLVHSVREAGRSLPASLDEGQRLDLEGDFPLFFRVYCEPGSERDALYLLTPDLMATLVDHAGLSSIELVGDAILCFSPGALRVDAVDGWEGIQRLLTDVGPRLLERARWLGGGVQQTPTLDGWALPAGRDVTVRPRLRSSTSLRNRSTFVVESICALVVAGAFAWAWLHH